MEFTVKTTRRNELVNITAEVRRSVKASGAKDGICVVWCPHTTAGITVNENADPAVTDDILMGLDRVVDAKWPFRHAEGNSDAHLKSTLVGCERTVVVRGGELRLGTWQGIFFCEFDGPRIRKVELKVIAG